MALSQIPASTFNSLVAPGLCVADPGLPACSKVGANGHQLELTPIGSCRGWGRSIHGKTQVLDTRRFVKTCNRLPAKDSHVFQQQTQRIEELLLLLCVLNSVHPPGSKKGAPILQRAVAELPRQLCPPPVSRVCSSSPSLPWPFPQRAQTHHNFLAARRKRRRRAVRE